MMSWRCEEQGVTIGTCSSVMAMFFYNSTDVKIGILWKSKGVGEKYSPTGDRSISKLCMSGEMFSPTVDRTVPIIPGKGQICLQGGGVQDIIYDVISELLAWRCHTHRLHDVLLWTTKTILKSDYALKRRCRKITNQYIPEGTRESHPGVHALQHPRLGKPRREIANHGISDGIPLSLPECSDIFYYSFHCLFRWLHTSFIYRLIKSITTLRKWHRNSIRVSIICNPWRGFPSRGCCKSWARGWDSLALPQCNDTLSHDFYL